MKHLSLLLAATAAASCASASGGISRADFLGVSCSSNDGGKTCYGYGERYADGTEDACGRVPNGGPAFALRLTYQLSPPTVCSTVVKTSHPNVMPVGDKFCSVYLGRNSLGMQYRFTDDEPGKVRQGYRARRSDKWCQHLIDAL